MTTANTTPDAEMPDSKTLEAMAIKLLATAFGHNGEEYNIGWRDCMQAALSCAAYRAWLANRASPSVERMLPELPEGWELITLKNVYIGECQKKFAARIENDKSLDDHTGHGSNPREAVLAALKRIGGAG